MSKLWTKAEPRHTHIHTHKQGRGAKQHGEMTEKALVDPCCSTFWSSSSLIPTSSRKMLQVHPPRISSTCRWARSGRKGNAMSPNQQKKKNFSQLKISFSYKKGAFGASFDLSFGPKWTNRVLPTSVKAMANNSAESSSISASKARKESCWKIAGADVWMYYLFDC